MLCFCSSHANTSRSPAVPLAGRGRKHTETALSKRNTVLSVVSCKHGMRARLLIHAGGYPVGRWGVSETHRGAAAHIQLEHTSIVLFEWTPPGSARFLCFFCHRTRNTSAPHADNHPLSVTFHTPSCLWLKARSTRISGADNCRIRETEPFKESREGGVQARGREKEQ